MRGMEGAPRVFISYARADGEPFATTLRDRLTTQEPGISLWRDRDRLEGGIGWWKQIEAALDAVEILVLIMTPAAMTSEYAIKEWRYARQQGVRVYPVKGASDDELEWSSTPRWMRKAHFFDLDKEWGTFVNYLKSPGQTIRVPFMAPDLPEGYIERPELIHDLVHHLLDPEQKNPVAVTTTLKGAGGLGKTTLAAAVCHREEVLEAFDDGVLWVTLGQTPAITSALLKLYAAITGERPAFVDEEDAAFHLAEKLTDKACLIVIDDVWDTAHLRPFLRGGKSCTRLVTTRQLDVAQDSDRVDVDRMTPAESVQLLTSGLDIPDRSRDAFTPLADRLDHWPLLLELAGATIRHRVARGDALDRALEALDQMLSRRGPAAFDRRRPSERNQAIALTIDASLEPLDAEDRTRLTELAVTPLRPTSLASVRIKPSEPAFAAP
jgi:hypothetical protein